MDIETNPKTREPEEIAFYMPTREKDQREFSAKIPHAGEFQHIFKKAIEFVEQARQNDNDEILILGWNLAADKAVLEKMCIKTMTPLMPAGWKQRDTMRVFKRAFPYFENHQLQYVAKRLGSKRYEPIHRAHPDNKTHYGVVRAAAHNIAMNTLYGDLADMTIGLETASNRLISSYQMVPVAVEIATSNKVKTDKMDDALYPSVLAINALCFRGARAERFEVFIKPPEGTEIDPLYSNGLTMERLKDEKPFPEAFEAFKLWLDQNVGPTGRNLLFGYEWYNKNGKALKNECERYGVALPDHCFDVSLDYVKTLMLPEYDPGYWEKQGKEHTELQKKSIGFERNRFEDGQDQVYYDLLDHFHISRRGDRLTQEMELFDSLLPVSDPAVRIALMRDKKIFDKRIKTITDAAKVNCVVHDIFLKVETTGIPKDKTEEPAKGFVVKIDAYDPNKPLGERRFTRLVNPQKRIMKEAAKLHGITDDQVAGAPTLDRLAPKFWSWATNGLKAWEKVHFICQGATHFVKPALKADLERYGLPMRRDVQWFCVQNLAQSLPRIEKCSLPDMADQLNAKGEGALLVYKVFKKMIRPLTVEEVYPAILTRKNKRSSKPIAALVERAQYDEIMEAEAAKKEEAEARKEAVLARRSRKPKEKMPVEGRRRRSQRLADKKNV